MKVEDRKNRVLLTDPCYEQQLVSFITLAWPSVNKLGAMSMATDSRLEVGLSTVQ